MRGPLGRTAAHARGLSLAPAKARSEASSAKGATATTAAATTLPPDGFLVVRGEDVPPPYVVTHEGARVLVNGREVAAFRAEAPYSGHGRPLDAWAALRGQALDAHAAATNAGARPAAAAARLLEVLQASALVKGAKRSGSTVEVTRVGGGSDSIDLSALKKPMTAELQAGLLSTVIDCGVTVLEELVLLGDGYCVTLPIARARRSYAAACAAREAADGPLAREVAFLRALGERDLAVTLLARG